MSPRRWLRLVSSLLHFTALALAGLAGVHVFTSLMADAQAKTWAAVVIALAFVVGFSGGLLRELADRVP